MHLKWGALCLYTYSYSKLKKKKSHGLIKKFFFTAQPPLPRKVISELCLNLMKLEPCPEGSWRLR